jgi:hypothetical protein
MDWTYSTHKRLLGRPRSKWDNMSTIQTGVTEIDCVSVDWFAVA